MFSFSVLKKDRKSNARSGSIMTAHGAVHTPAFIPVGTKATVKSLTSDEVQASGTGMFFVNTYHLYLEPGDEVVKRLGGLHRFMHWDGPIITDSGGFQVFSLGSKKFGKIHGDDVESLVKVTDDGVEFKSYSDGSAHFFSPEKSLTIQQNLGADIILPLDECTPNHVRKKYAKQSLNRTHEWAKRSLEFFNTRKNKNQALYGIVQGSVFEDLRKNSARLISSLPFSGIAIGGVSVGETKKEVRHVLDWIVPILPENKPRHLLGVGEIDDIFTLVEKGIDTFDCVLPTRMGRMGKLLTKQKWGKRTSYDSGQKLQRHYEIDVLKTEFKEDKLPPDPTCPCFVCRQYSRAYLRHLFKARELLAYRLATFHNLYFIQNLMHDIRRSIEDGSFAQLKKTWIGV